MKNPNRLGSKQNLSPLRLMTLGGLCLTLTAGLVSSSAYAKNNREQSDAKLWTTSEVVSRFPHGGTTTAEPNPNDVLLVSGDTAFFSNSGGKDWTMISNPSGLPSDSGTQIMSASFAPVEAMDPGEDQVFVLVYENADKVEIQMNEVKPNGTVERVNRSGGRMNLTGATGQWSRDAYGQYYTENATQVGPGQLEDLGVGEYGSG